MADESLSVAGQLPAALSAFLRGAERRAFVFLWLQGGDAAAAERALAAAIRAFPGPAACGASGRQAPATAPPWR